jgi:hypothetical protein
MKKQQISFANAFIRIKTIRKIICPNLGFELQLKKYQESIGLANQESSIKSNKKKDDGNAKKEEKDKKKFLFNFEVPDSQETNLGNRTSNSKQFAKFSPHQTHFKKNVSKKSPIE